MTGENVEVAFVDQGYRGETAAQEAEAHGMRLEVVKLEEAWPLIASDALEDLLRDTAATYKG